MKTFKKLMEKDQETADQAFKRNSKDVKSLMKKIQKGVTDMEKEWSKSDKTNWGFNGSMSQIRSELENVLFDGINADRAFWN